MPLKTTQSGHQDARSGLDPMFCAGGAILCAQGAILCAEGTILCALGNTKFNEILLEKLWFLFSSLLVPF